MRAPLKSADPGKRIHHYVVHEVGPRWFELVDTTTSEKSGLDIYELKLMRRVRTRYYHADGTTSVSSTAESEVEGLRRTVEVTAESTVNFLRDGTRFIKQVLITQIGSTAKFSGQITFHAGGHVSLTGYRG